MEYNIPIKRESYNKAALKVINFALDLTNYELDLLSTMLDNNIKTIDTNARIDLMDLLTTDYYTLTNYIKKLKDKDILKESPYGLSINPNLLNSLSDKKFVINFNLL